MNRYLVGCAALVLSGSVLAQNVYDSKFGIGGGVFFPSADTSLRVDASNSDIGTGIDLEGDLNFDKDDTVGRLTAFWRPAQKHRIFVDYYAIDRSSRTTLKGDLEIDGEIYPIDTVVNASFDTTVVPIFYEYSIYQTPRTEVGIGGGVHWLDLEFAINATGTTLNEFSSVSGPLPLIGFSVDHMMTDQWMFTGSLQAFSANVGDYDGSIVSAAIGVEYWFNRNFSLGVGYDYFDLDVDLDKQAWTGNVNYGYDGANLRIVARF
ncbi:MAG: hypothetical protein DHS20C11_02630 [Lysobacteraceae bacterium]|nr:MAG: hypothetical protein DHS20C11_02630 [Xanthomonadaceae bacterium]